VSEHARILVIDDDESIRKTISAILEEEGYIVDTAENGKEAIRKSNASFYNLALIDIRLPDVEGTKLLKTLKETTPKMAKIIITGYPSLDNAIEAVNKGADGYLLKPLDIDKLLSSVKEHIRRQGEARKYSEEKFAEFVESRAKEWEHAKTGNYEKSG